MRRIAIAAESDQGLDSVVSPHFGRCPYFVLVDLDRSEIRSVRGVANPYYDHHEPGQVPRFISAQGAHVMIAGGMGARAVDFFAQHGVEAVTGAMGTVRSALERYMGGALNRAAPCAESHGHHCGKEDGDKDGMAKLREEMDMLGKQLDEIDNRLKGLHNAWEGG